MPAVVKRQATSRTLVLDPAGRIRHLSDHGSSVAIDKAIPVKRYFRSGSEMERQARVYYSEGQWERAFILYNKFATLFIEKLPKHPEHSKAPAADKAKIKKLIKLALTRAMDLKDKLKEKYEKEKEELENVMQEEEAEISKKNAESDIVEKDHSSDQSEEISAFFGGQGGVVTTASSEVVGVDSVLAPAQAPPSLPPAQSQPPPARESVASPMEQETMATNEQTEQQLQQLDVTPTNQSELTATDPALAQVLPGYDPAPTAPPLAAPPFSVATPPSIPPPVSTFQQFPPSYEQIVASTGLHPLPPPQMTPPAIQPQGAPLPHPSLHQPTYEGSLFQSPFTNSSQAPPLTTPPPGSPYSPPYAVGVQQPGATWTQAPSASHTYQSGGAGVGGTGRPVVDRSTKPDSLKALNTGPGWGSTGVEGYRPVYIPADTASRFEALASPNTRRNIETCGILAGKLSQNTLRITHIVVPKQTGRADSCETLNEEEIFDVQDQYDLITLGWIHTHPSQTAFMSSVDLHCHCSYQIMMDEAVAIVVAPKYNQVGYYMLTEPHGLNYITHCEEEGFHVHQKEPPLYEDCKHIQHDASTFIQIVDLS